MSTRFHCHFDIDHLQKQSDEMLLQMLKGGSAVEIRAALVCLKASGKSALVVGKCDNQSPVGTCNGHQIEPLTSDLSVNLPG